MIDINHQKEVKFNNRYYHENCFKCSNCQTNLNNSTNNRLKLNEFEEALCPKCELSQAKICYICKELILHGEIILFDQNNYHPNCFNCHQCQKSLIDQTNLHIHQSKAYCFQCYSQYFAPKCEQCFQPISSGKSTEFGGKLYHLDCFRCGQCNERIIGQELYTYNSKPCCIQCYEKSVAPQCTKCLKRILNEKYTIFNGNKYHVECFQCDHCHQRIVDQEFPTDNGKVYCNQCYEEYLSPKCFQCSKSILSGKAIISNEKKYHPECFQCDHCHQRIINEKCTILNGNKYHPECFKCDHCHQRIVDQQFPTNNGKVYCNQCYEEYLLPKCFQCSKSILSGKAIISNEKKYHVECFQCDHCHQRIVDEEFLTDNGKVYCNQCYEEYLTPKCFQCSKSILSGKSIISNEKKYHPECFRCFKCNQIINQSKYYTHQSKPCCNECYYTYFTLKCEKCSKPILENHTTYQGKHFHIQCFTCQTCHRIIEGKDKFYNGQFGILCSTCAI